MIFTKLCPQVPTRTCDRQLTVSGLGPMTAATVTARARLVSR